MADTARGVPQGAGSGDMSARHFTTIRLRQRDDGQDLIEYALLTGLIALVAFAGVTAVGNAVADSFWAVIAAAIPQ